MARTVRRLPAGSGADTTLLRESIGTPWDPMLGTVTENNIPMPEIFHRDVVPAVQEAESPIVKTHGEDPTVEQKQVHEHERAEASANSTGPSSSDHDADVPMTDVFETSLRYLDTRRSCSGKGGRLCCEQGADRENLFFFSTGSVKLGHYCFSSSCCAGYVDSASQSITTCMIVAGCAAGLGIYLLLVGASHCFFTGLESRLSGTLGLSGTLHLSVSLGEKSTRGRLP